MNFNKYHAKKIKTVDGTFDSQKEYKRWNVLKVLQRSNKISNLERQVKFELQPSFKLNGKTVRGISYYADFVYKLNGSKVVEDCKGFKTPVYKLKKKMFEYKYQTELKES